jgi:Spy/CpxP family protein refolding chaperone
MARAQGESRDPYGADAAAGIEQAERGPGMRGGMEDSGTEGPGFSRHRGPGGLRGMRGGPGSGGRGFGLPLEAVRELDLTDAQHERLADIRTRHLKAAIPIEADLRLAELDLEQLTRADRPDAQAVDRQIDRISGLRASLMKNRMAGMLEGRAVLTPIQQKKLRELKRDGSPGPRAPREDAPRRRVSDSR